MRNMSDDDLINELKYRFDQKDKALFDLKVMTSKLESLNKKLEDSEALKSHFLSNIKNEINNPLTSILGLTEQIVKTDEMDFATVKTMLNMIHFEAFNLDYQLRNIFMAAEIEAGESNLDVSHVDVVSLISNTVDSFKPLAESKYVKLTFLYDWKFKKRDEYLFKTDPEKLKVVIANLVCNAIEFNNEGGSVEIKLWKDGKTMQVSISDTGIGITEEDRSKIFDRFRQLDTGVSKLYRGHGLGLSIVKAIVDLFGGSVFIESTVGQGSIFFIGIEEATLSTAVDVYSLDGNEFLFEEEGDEVF